MSLHYYFSSQATVPPSITFQLPLGVHLMAVYPGGPENVAVAGATVEDNRYGLAVDDNRVGITIG